MSQKKQPAPDEQFLQKELDEFHQNIRKALASFFKYHIEITELAQVRGYRKYVSKSTQSQREAYDDRKTIRHPHILGTTKTNEIWAQWEDEWQYVNNSKKLCMIGAGLTFFIGGLETGPVWQVFRAEWDRRPSSLDVKCGRDTAPRPHWHVDRHLDEWITPAIVESLDGSMNDTHHKHPLHKYHFGMAWMGNITRTSPWEHAAVPPLALLPNWAIDVLQHVLSEFSESEIDHSSIVEEL